MEPEEVDHEDTRRRKICFFTTLVLLMLSLGVGLYMVVTWHLGRCSASTTYFDDLVAIIIGETKSTLIKYDYEDDPYCRNPDLYEISIETQIQPTWPQIRLNITSEGTFIEVEPVFEVHEGYFPITIKTCLTKALSETCAYGTAS